MTENKPANSTLTTLESKVERLDKAAETFSSALAVTNSPFKSALMLSQGITALRDLLDDGIMREIMKIADTPLGFLTDRGPGAKFPPYKIEEVRDAIIEASLRGFRVAGNEFNIISGRFYAAKNGLHRRVINYPGLTDFKEVFGIPKLSGDRGAIVSARATWIKDGVKCGLEREFAIRVNAMMGTDAIIGKCQRKLYSAVLNQVSGIVTPEGEIDDQTSKEVTARPKFAGKESSERKSNLSFLTSGDTPTPEEIAKEKAEATVLSNLSRSIDEDPEGIGHDE